MSEIKRKYSTIVGLRVDQDGTYYLARHPEIDGCLSEGATPEEALSNLEEVTEMILSHLRENDLPIPDPQPLFSTPQQISRQRQIAIPGQSVEGARFNAQPIPA